MNLFKHTIIKKDMSIEQKNVLWNMLSSISYSLLSVILLMFVTRVLGQDSAGMFAIAFTTSQILLTISYYELRPYQVTDVQNKYSFSEYFTVRIITTIIMILVAVIYIAINSYSFEKSLTILLLCLYRATDGVSEIIQGEYQSKSKLYIAGKILFFQTMLSSLSFILGIYLFKDIIKASAILIVSSITSLIVFDRKYKINRDKIKIITNKIKIINLLKTCFPVFLGAFMFMYIANSSKYAIDKFLTNKEQLIYNIIYMPAFTINLFSSFIFKPMLTTLAEYWVSKKYERFKKLLAILIMGIIILTIIVIVAGIIIGIPVLNMMYGVDISSYKLAFVFILIGGGFNALSVLIYYGLIVIRQQVQIFYSYILTFIVSIFLPYKMVEKYSINGAALSYCILLAILTCIFIAFFVASSKKEVKENL